MGSHTRCERLQVENQAEARSAFSRSLACGSSRRFIDPIHHRLDRPRSVAFEAVVYEDVGGLAGLPGALGDLADRLAGAGVGLLDVLIGLERLDGLLVGPAFLEECAD